MFLDQPLSGSSWPLILILRFQCVHDYPLFRGNDHVGAGNIPVEKLIRSAVHFQQVVAKLCFDRSLNRFEWR